MPTFGPEMHNPCVRHLAPVGISPSAIRSEVAVKALGRVVATVRPVEARCMRVITDAQISECLTQKAGRSPLHLVEFLPLTLAKTGNVDLCPGLQHHIFSNGAGKPQHSGPEAPHV